MSLSYRRNFLFFWSVILIFTRFWIKKIVPHSPPMYMLIALTIPTHLIFSLKNLCNQVLLFHFNLDQFWDDCFRLLLWRALLCCPQLMSVRVKSVFSPRSTVHVLRGKSQISLSSFNSHDILYKHWQSETTTDTRKRKDFSESSVKTKLNIEQKWGDNWVYSLSAARK